MASEPAVEVVSCASHHKQADTAQGRVPAQQTAPGHFPHPRGRKETLMGLIILIILVLLVVGALPIYPYSRKWGYAPGGTLTVLLVILIVLMLMGRI